MLIKYHKTVITVKFGQATPWVEVTVGKISEIVFLNDYAPKAT